MHIRESFQTEGRASAASACIRKMIQRAPRGSARKTLQVTPGVRFDAVSGPGPAQPLSSKGGFRRSFVKSRLFREQHPRPQPATPQERCLARASIIAPGMGFEPAAYGCQALLCRSQLRYDVLTRQRRPPATQWRRQRSIWGVIRHRGRRTVLPNSPPPHTYCCVEFSTRVTAREGRFPRQWIWSGGTGAM